MAIVKIEQYIYDEIKELVESDITEFPSIKTFVNKCCKEKLKEIKMLRC